MSRFLCLASTLTVLSLLLGTSARADDKKDGKKDEKPADPHADLIGKPAPEITSEFSFNTKTAKLSELKGKVVLVDFWAVWCGPCVATFPHLRDWNKEYKDKGLEIVGVTSYYENYDFDKKEGKLTRAKEKLTKDQEHQMLKDFAEHHKLQHRLLTLNKADTQKVYGDYKVRGIPQAVLIDRKGNIRMIKVGSGDENAKALEGMIKELLAEK